MAYMSENSKFEFIYVIKTANEDPHPLLPSQKKEEEKKKRWLVIEIIHLKQM